MIVFIILGFLKHGACWKLAMNLNPKDGGIHHYCNKWDESMSEGAHNSALKFDFIDKDIRLLPVNYIAKVLHQDDIPEAIKIWKFKESNISLLQRFKNTASRTVTEGGDLLTVLPRNYH